MTYTTNSTAELRSKCYGMLGCVPEHIEVSTWFRFLLRHFVRPYQRELYDCHVRKLLFVQGRSKPYVKEADTDRFYFGAPGEILSDKIAQFACKLIDETDRMPIARLEKIFQRIYIDESQDLAGYDLELIDRLLDTEISVRLMGDHRQATYSTNSSPKNKAYRGHKIVNKFSEWSDAGRAKLTYLNESHRCIQPICDFADALFPDFPKTLSRNETVSGHDGVFAVRTRNVEKYMATYKPQTLRFDRKTNEVPGNPLNFGEAKGMTFKHVLIFPHPKLRTYLKTGKLADAGASLAKIYVGITRAEQSVAFVVPDKAADYIVPVFEPELTLVPGATETAL